MRHTFHTDDCRFPFLNAVRSHAAKDGCALGAKSGNNVRRTGERLRGQPSAIRIKCDGNTDLYHQSLPSGPFKYPHDICS